MKYLKPFILILLLAVLTSACDFFGKDDDPGTSGESDVYCFWLAASKDAYVSSSLPDYNYDGTYSLVCSHGEPNHEQRFYVEFFMPQLPEGAEVLEAYINIYEDSQTGQAGVVTIPFGEAVAEWDPYSITWNDQPNPIGPFSTSAGQIGPYTTYNTWRTTDNIKGIVQKHLDDSSTNHGWLFNNSSAIAFTRSFKSMNALDARTRTELQLGPRLLMKIKSATAISTSNIGTILTGSTELGNMYGFGTEILVYSIQSGENWPESWNVASQ
ncbi:MAG: DNRLRE domain-containing protein [Prolixibacteraceae bacterium]|nr:DNRLRE domain-containing protein [Prolixibacteraceae bacterium]